MTKENASEGVLGIITATEARLRYDRKDYRESLTKANKAIQLASKTMRSCIVDVAKSTGYEVKKTLVDYGGFNVIIRPDPENDSSELTISW